MTLLIVFESYAYLTLAMQTLTGANRSLEALLH